jgi:hypothetical protein
MMNRNHRAKIILLVHRPRSHLPRRRMRRRRRGAGKSYTSASSIAQNPPRSNALANSVCNGKMWLVGHSNFLIPMCCTDPSQRESSDTHGISCRGCLRKRCRLMGCQHSARKNMDECLVWISNWVVMCSGEIKKSMQSLS